MRMPRVVYCDTACQTQRNALLHVPWLLTEEEVSFFIDRFHQCGHVCSPVFEADEYPEISRGHDTSSAERQLSIKKKSKSFPDLHVSTPFHRALAIHGGVQQHSRVTKAGSQGKEPCSPCNQPGHRATRDPAPDGRVVLPQGHGGPLRGDGVPLLRMHLSRSTAGPREEALSA